MSTTNTTFDLPAHMDITAMCTIGEFTTVNRRRAILRNRRIGWLCVGVIIAQMAIVGVIHALGR